MDAPVAVEVPIPTVVETMHRMKYTPKIILDKMQCGVSGCTEKHGEFYLHARCHIESRVEVCYYDGKILVACGECKKPVVLVEVK
jgi:hypothetical protein